MGWILFAVAAWLIFSLGDLDKGEKFWTYKTYLTAGMIVFWVIVNAVSSGSSSDSETNLHDVIRFSMGLAFGLVYCIFHLEEMRTEKQYPFWAGIAAVMWGVLFTEAFFHAVSWLNKLTA